MRNARTRRPTPLNAPLIQLLEPRLLLSTNNGAAPVATTLVFVRQPPATIVAGAKLSKPVKVKVEDQFGKIMKTDDATITLQVMDKTIKPANVSTDDPPPVEALPPVTAMLKKGIATFTTLPSVSADPSHFAVATSPGLPEADSRTFAITPAAKTHLFIGFLPSAALPQGEQFGFDVITLDKYNNYASPATSTISLEFAAAPAGATPIHLTSKLKGGDARFSVDFTVAGSYQFRASGHRFAAVTSDPFEIA